MTRSELHQLRAFNVVIERAFDGGVTTTFRPDAHGRSRSIVVLCLEFDDDVGG